MNISSLSSGDIVVYNDNLKFGNVQKLQPQKQVEQNPRTIDTKYEEYTKYEIAQKNLENSAKTYILSSINATISDYKPSFKKYDYYHMQDFKFDEAEENRTYVAYNRFTNEYDTIAIHYDALKPIHNIETFGHGLEYNSSFRRTYDAIASYGMVGYFATDRFYDMSDRDIKKPDFSTMKNSFCICKNSYFENINYDGIIDPLVIFDTKPLNLNSYANSNLLKTPYGEVTIFYDEFDDNDKLGFGTFSSNSLLFNFDSNGDGIVDANDKLFNKLKVRGYDINGNEKIAKLSDVMPSINLRDFINDDIINYNDKYIDEYNSKYPHQKIDKSKLDYRLSYNASNPYTKFKAEYRYEMIEEKELNKFFEMYANEDGWVDLTNNHNAIFNKNSAFHNFAYMKKDLNGELSLSEFNPIFSDKKLDKDFSYTNYQKQNFMKFYDDYYKELNSHNKNIEWLSKNLKDYDVKDADIYIDKLKDIKSPYLIAMENEFKEATGLDFSLENLNKVKQAFDINKTKTANALKDTDSVVAMKLNKNGSITLKFNSGRQIVVNELYSDTGKLLGDKDKQVSVNLKAKNMNEDELNLLVSTKSDSIGIKTENNRYQTLKDLGVKSIKKLSNNKFILYLQDNTFITTKELYNITYIDRFLNDSSGLNNNSNSLNKNSNNNNSNLNLNDNNSNSLNLNNNLNFKNNLNNNNNLNSNLNNHNKLNSNNNINNSINNNGLNLDNNSSNLNNLSLNLNNTTNKTIHPNDMFYRKVDVRV
ncbi:hypothetical protein [Campylobacter sputorum]|uniref:hypothetical protein n=1 Tax=Campylobacter sputorum TaxID=206 RepID=UPI000B7845F0|nr:hypothetical protein [Campylobacter sputorum]ASM36187.1 hypothetical protein CSF_0270 [Campylobacter sputorum bv. faecalis CCUG 20703]